MFGPRVLRIVFALALVQITLSSPLISQTHSDPSPNKSNEQDQLPANARTFNSAYDLLTAYFSASDRQDWTDAADCLDFSGMPNDISSSTKQNLAFRLKEIIDRLAYVDMDNVQDSKASRYRIPPNDSDAPVEIAPNADGDWLFTARTVAQIDSLYDQYKDRPKVAGQNWLERRFRQISPDLMNKVFLLPNYQWICLFLVIVIGFIADLITRLLLQHLTSAWFRFIKSKEMTQVELKVWKPAGLLAQALTWYFGTLVIGLPPTVLAILLFAVKFFAIVVGVWTAFRLIDVLAAYIGQRAARTETKFDDLLVPLVSKSLKVFAIVIGILMGAEAFDLPVTGLIGGLGLGGAALAFASKDAVSNVFGSVTVLTDRPFEIGDWIVTEDVEGTVEQVGFRSTRVRTFYNSQITLPNSRLTTAVVDNLGRRRYRRIKSTLGVQYDTRPEQMDAFCEGIRELIRRHPYTRKDYYHVYFNGFGDSALEVLLYCFLECPDWSVELREKHRLYLDIVRLAHSLGVSFAFPTRTLHLFNEQHTAQDVQFTGAQAEAAGKRFAAGIAGPLLTGDQRPGPVEFTGPADIGDADSEVSG